MFFSKHSMNFISQNVQEQVVPPSPPPVSLEKITSKTTHISLLIIGSFVNKCKTCSVILFQLFFDDKKVPHSHLFQFM